MPAEAGQDSEQERHFVYILKCADGTYYTGWTTDPAHRLETHNSGKGAKYTRSRRPVEMVHLEEYSTKSEALRREIAIKRLSRDEKQALIESGNRLPAIDDAFGIHYS